jgi:hypothetical protein
MYLYCPLIYWRIFSQKRALVTLMPQPPYRMARHSKKMAAEKCIYIFWTPLYVKRLPAKNTCKLETFVYLPSLTSFLIMKTNNMFEQNWSQGISVGIATSYRLDDRGSILCRNKNVCLLHSVQTSTGAHPTSSPMGTGGYFLEGLADYPPYYRGQERRSNISTLPYVFVACYVII